MGRDDLGQSRPRDSVFTTVTWDGLHHIADLQTHLQRLSSHAKRLRLDLPMDLEKQIKRAFEAITPLQNGQLMQPVGLVKIKVDCKVECQIQLSPRKIVMRDEEIEAITQPAPRWNRKVTGTKHGDWAPYHQARIKAEASGSDLALLVHDFCIIDGDRASPIVLDEDGIVWYSDSSQGGVESITRNIVLSGLKQHGFPVQSGKLTERIVARSLEMVALGSGMGASRIITLDDHDIGADCDTLTMVCRQILAAHYSDKDNWTEVL